MLEVRFFFHQRYYPSKACSWRRSTVHFLTLSRVSNDNQSLGSAVDNLNRTDVLEGICISLNNNTTAEICLSFSVCFTIFWYISGGVGDWNKQLEASITLTSYIISYKNIFWFHD